MGDGLPGGKKRNEHQMHSTAGKGSHPPRKLKCRGLLDITTNLCGSRNLTIESVNA